MVLNDTLKIKKNKTLYRDIVSILGFYEKKEKLDIPISVQTKFECLKKICELKADGKTSDNALDSVLVSEKFKQLHDFANFKKDEKLTQEAVEDNVKQVRLRKKLNSLFSNYDQLSNFLDQLKDGSFESIDDLVLDYENIIKTLFTNMMTEGRGIAIEASSSLDLAQDDYEHVLSMIQKKYERKNAVATGFPILDNEVLNGGLEPSRVYIIAGASGSGKSTLITNIIINAATKDVHIIDNEIVVEAIKDGINRVFIYVTLENTIDESLMRIYQAMFRKTLVELLRDISNGIDIKQVINNELKKTGSTIIMKYFKPRSISALDVMAVVDEAIATYGKGTIKGLYVDYLDLLKTDAKYDLYRIELGDITLSFKAIAIDYNIPVVIPTQLGRSAYRIQNSRDLNVDQVGESIKKVEHADFVMLMSKDPASENKVYGQVGKNRSGKSNVNIDFNVDFSTYKFISANKVSNEKADILDSNKINFGGLGNTW